MFKAIQKRTSHSDAESKPKYVTLSIDQQSYQIPEGYSVTAAMLSIGHNSNRYSPISGKKRGPYCLMGVCFECVCQIDGIANRQGCMTIVASGMQIEHQQGGGYIQEATIIQETTIDETASINLTLEEPKNAL